MDDDPATNVTHECFGTYSVDSVHGDTAIPGVTVKEYIIKAKNVGCLLSRGNLRRLCNHFGVTVFLESNAVERDTGIARIIFLGYERNIGQACSITRHLVNEGYFNMANYGYRGNMPKALLQINSDGAASVGSYEETIPLDMANLFFGKDDRLICELEARTGAWILVKPFVYEKDAVDVYIRRVTIFGTDHQVGQVMRTMERKSVDQASG